MIPKYDQITHEECHKLIEEITSICDAMNSSACHDYNKLKRQHDRLVEELVGSHMGIIKKVAFEYAEPSNKDDIDDLVGVGIESFMRAIPNYFNNEVKTFSTWIYYRIDKGIKHYLSKRSRKFSITPLYTECFSKIVLCAEQLEWENKQSPTIQEVADAMEIHPKLVDVAIKVASTHVFSGNEAISDGSGDSSSCYWDVIEDEQASEVTESTISMDRSYVDELVLDLPQAMFHTMTLRFGSHDAYKYSIEQITEEYESPNSKIKLLEDELLSAAKNDLDVYNQIKGFFNVSTSAAPDPSPDLLKHLGIE